MTRDAMGFCMAIAGAHAALSLRLDDDLGAFHGLNFADFTLLYRLTQVHGGRMAMADLAPVLGLTVSALLRKLAPLEKIGLAERVAGCDADPRRHAALRPGGRQVMQNAITTVEVICADAVSARHAECPPELQAALLALCPNR